MRDTGQCIVILIQKDDASIFRPNWKIDPKFCHALVDACSSGIDILAYAVRFDGT